MDPIGHEKRSWVMARVKSRDTKPEKAVRSLLHRMGYRFRLYRADLPGKPDIVLPKHRAIIFVHGCFWHRHPGCKRASMPTDNAGYWRQKFERNVARDLVNRTALAAQGWRVLTIWECELRDIPALAKRLKGFLTNPDSHDSIPSATI